MNTFSSFLKLFRTYGIKNTKNVLKSLETLNENVGIFLKENQKNIAKPIIL
jgi:hypothetical protein